jgi:hypothetical protein
MGIVESGELKQIQREFSSQVLGRFVAEGLVELPDITLLWLRWKLWQG